MYPEYLNQDIELSAEALKNDAALDGLMKEARIILSEGKHYRNFCNERHALMSRFLKASNLN